MKKLPGSRTCFVCGRENPVSLKMEFYLDDCGEVRSNVMLSEYYAGYPGMVHGGNIVAMLDEASGRAVTSDDPNRFFVTSELKVKYLLPVPTNQPLKVVGKLVKKHGHVAIGVGEIRNENGQLLARSEAAFVDVTEKFGKGMDPEITGWKVYPDEE